MSDTNFWTISNGRAMPPDFTSGYNETPATTKKSLRFKYSYTGEGRRRRAPPSWKFKKKLGKKCSKPRIFLTIWVQLVNAIKMNFLVKNYIFLECQIKWYQMNSMSIL